MKKLLLVLACTIATIHAAPKMLHVGFHVGCLDDFKDVASTFNIDVTSWYALEEPRTNFDGSTNDNAIYNMGADRANRIWERHKEYFNKFDVIMTSDTAPLSRIFLQNEWGKPLIIWVCNRFDYFDGGSLDCDFPDEGYYDLLRKAAHKKNVHFISYTPYEYHYAQLKGVDIGRNVIRPVGSLPAAKKGLTLIPADVKKEDTLFVFPRPNKTAWEYVQKKCNEVGIKNYAGVYCGPDDLMGFKGIIYMPYVFSNLALFENIQRGLVHFVPSQKFIIDQVVSGQIMLYVTLHMFEWCEWYASAYKHLFVYFDSWQDLKNKIETTDYDAMRTRVLQTAHAHRHAMLNRWHTVLSACGLSV